MEGVIATQWVSPVIMQSAYQETNGDAGEIGTPINLPTDIFTMLVVASVSHVREDTVRAIVGMQNQCLDGVDSVSGINRMIEHLMYPEVF